MRVGAWSEGRVKSDEGGEGQGGKAPAWTSKGFDPLKVISKYIIFKGSKERNLF